MQFLEWRSNDWLGKANLRGGTIKPSVHTGLLAYANKQRSVFHHLAIHFSQRWHSVFISLSLPHTWATEFLSTHGESLDNLDFKKRKQSEDPPVPHPRVDPPSPTTPINSTLPPPIIPDGIDNNVQVSNVDSDGSSSEYSESGYESMSSWAE